MKTWSRASTIFPRWLVTPSPSTTAASVLPVYVTESMVGHKLGEFAPTRTFRGHKAKWGLTVNGN